MKTLPFVLGALLLLGPSTHAAEKPEPKVYLEQYQLSGDLSNGHAKFILRATARVESAKETSLVLLRGPVALTEFVPNPKWRLSTEEDAFVAHFERRGSFPIEIHFEAAVQTANGWSQLDFTTAASTLQPVSLRGLPAETQFEFADAARPDYRNSAFESFLAGDGRFHLRWKEASAEAGGKLFYAAEMLSQIAVSPGLLRQTALLNFKVMQGDLSQVTLLLRGNGEVTRVQGDPVLAWKIQPGDQPGVRRLVVQFNQSQKDQFSLQLQTQAALGAFPQVADVLQVQPEAATRFAGYFRLVNDGAVRLEVLQATGLSQISPEQFPETELTRSVLRPLGNQRFAYRFSGPGTALRIQADQILPELTVSEILSYHLGENELAIAGEFELDIREAPLRELVLRVPAGYAIAQLQAAGLSDYFQTEAENQQSDLRLVFAQPVSGRQVVQLRLERNKPLEGPTWTLPRIDVPKAKSLRGYVATAADAGFRISPERTSGLTEIATAFFPRKLPGIQTSFRLNEATWQSVVRVERLPQAIQADVLHLFSIGEGVAYGSSVINYLVSGAPVSVFRVELSDEYFNVEFTGKDIRNWQKVPGGYQVQLHTPITGPYTLLGTYERPFKPQGETLSFTGVRPLDVQSEQGHTLIISAYQFQVKPVEVSPGLLPLEPGELPAEYRLLFDAPVLAAYRYVARPISLRLALSPLAQSDSLSLVVDRASLNTRISKQGQVITDARYFVKNRGNLHLRVTLPAGSRLWAASVNGAPVVPVADGSANLIPLPQGADPNAVLTLDLKVASASTDAKRILAAAPIVDAPVMLARWNLAPDVDQRLIYQTGSLKPAGGDPDVSGFSQVRRWFTGAQMSRTLLSLLTASAFLTLGWLGIRWARGAAYRFNGRQVVGLGLGTAALLAAAVLLANLVSQPGEPSLPSESGLSFIAPVQQAGSSLTVQVLNVAGTPTFTTTMSSFWPALLSVAFWIFAWRRRHSLLGQAAVFAGWMIAAWVALTSAHGAAWFAIVLGAAFLVHIIVPAVALACRVPPRKREIALGHSSIGPASAGLVLLCTAFWFTRAGWASTPTLENSIQEERGVAELVQQEIRIEKQFALATATVRWEAEKGQKLPLLFEPAVLTQIDYPKDWARLSQESWSANGGTNPCTAQTLVAKRKATITVKFHYQLPIVAGREQSGICLPLPGGLVNQLRLQLVGQDVAVSSPDAVAVRTDWTSGDTVAELVLRPAAAGIWVGWKPRSRDVTRERPVFYADVAQVFIPSAGVIEAGHSVSIRLAQGELSELFLDVPAGMTITDVQEAVRPQSNSAEPRSTPLVSFWRFDPDQAKLRIVLSSSQARPFTLLIKSQIAAGPLPFEKSLALLSVAGAAEEIGSVAVATGNDVQLDSATPEGLTPINLEDFSAELLTELNSHTPGLTVRRAFRYGQSRAQIVVKASAVEPDIRVESQDTLSVGEDRTVLAVNTTVGITRAGIFRLSFELPPSFEIESITGAALSHWTEFQSSSNRVVTVHLNGKTEGQQSFAITLAGPGARATNGWVAPQLTFRESGKQSGTMLLVPEQGLRLQVATSDGLAQLDPQKSGIKQKGVLAFRVLQKQRSLVLNLEQVNSWIQVNSLQHATINEAQIQVIANLQYQIENAGLKSLRILIPTNAENVRFQGEQVADFLPVPGAVTNDLQIWEIKLHRRILGSYLLQASYQVAVPEGASGVSLRGAQVAEVNLQRGYVTLGSAGRLQLRVDTVPAALQPAEWQSIPRSLQQGLPASAASFSFRLVDPDFSLPLQLQRYQAAQMLPGRINSIQFDSVISDDGVMLTQAKLAMVPGSKRLLHLRLPKNARFWFAFVNQNGVWPWRENDEILIPLEAQPAGEQLLPVEIFYSCKIGEGGHRSLNLELLAPQFDLPLENITWRVSLGEKWEIAKCSGSLQLQRDELLSPATAVDFKSYLESESLQQQQRTKQAEGLLAAGNSALAQGDPQQARRAFQSAYGLSAHDAAFNEDARVQLHNIKLQEALVALNVRQAASTGNASALAARLRDLGQANKVNYTQQDAKEILDRNSSDENAAFMKLAERLIQQQDAAGTTPTALHASIPEQGRVLTFKRAVLVDPWGALRITLSAVPATPGQAEVRGLVLGFSLVLFGAVLWAGRIQKHAGR